MSDARRSGILLHVSSLPSPFGIGDLGPEAYSFVDLLAETGQSLWQILPLNPTTPLKDSSPYQSISGFAGNPLLISPEHLVRDGYLSPEDLEPVPDFPLDRVDDAPLRAWKERLLGVAWERFAGSGEKGDFESFRARESYWLEDYVLFASLWKHFDGRQWNKWPAALRDRDPGALSAFAEGNREAVDRIRFEQYLFFLQWSALKAYCHTRGVRVFGDMPIYLEYNSADLWAHPELFQLDEEKEPLFVAGVPPDYFSDTGQLWGNPIYRWETHLEGGFDWWIRRIGQNLRLYDLLRIDHFRGLVGYWEIPAGEETAMNGRWVPAPADELLTTLFKSFPPSSFVAEDLGVITPDVTAVLRKFRLPGMKVLIFAFSDDAAANPYIPHNHRRNSFVFTGTHDNNTVRGWIDSDATPSEKESLTRYLGREAAAGEVPEELCRIAMMSVADTAIFPVQDILGLGGDARMNNPATKKGNWKWRLRPGLLSDEVREKLRETTRVYGRSNLPD
jgi:4-alpha-glucanotransferase